MLDTTASVCSTDSQSFWSKHIGSGGTVQAGGNSPIPSDGDKVPPGRLEEFLAGMPTLLVSTGTHDVRLPISCLPLPSTLPDPDFLSN